MPKLAINWADLDALVAASPRGPKPWTPEEREVLTRYYPQYGSHAVVMALKKMGYVRSANAVQAEARSRGVRFR